MTPIVTFGDVVGVFALGVAAGWFTALCFVALLLRGPKK